MPTNGMTIDSLNTVSSLTAQDKVPVWDNESSGEPTKKITAQNMTNSVKTLGSLVNTTEMNDAIAQSTAQLANTIIIKGQVAGITNFNNLAQNSICWLNGDYANAPGSNEINHFVGHVITIYTLQTHGLQFALDYRGNAAYIRTFVGATWNNWYSIGLA